MVAIENLMVNDSWWWNLEKEWRMKDDGREEYGVYDDWDYDDDIDEEW